MSKSLEWMIVRNGVKDIGAIGFLGNDAVAVVSFFDDRDWNEDGQISLKEHIGGYLPLFGKKGRAIAKVAVQAYLSNPDIASRDPTLRVMAGKFWTKFAFDLIREGVYIVYFQRGVKAIGRGGAAVITASRVKQLVIRKGFEKAAKAAFDEATAL